MSVTAEDGSGIAGADVYADVALADAYWANRTHSALSATWTAADDAPKEGALREASDFVDATYGPHYRGVRRGFVQGRLWPRTGAKDDAGYPLPGLPDDLKNVTIELAARALSEPLAADAERGGEIEMIKAETVTIKYKDSAPAETTYGVVGKMLHSILDGTQPGATGARWDWE